MDGFAIAAVLEELRPRLEGAFIRNVYQPTRSVFLLRLSGRGSVDLRISPKDALLHATQLEIENPATPSPFAMLLRKHLRGGRIREASQWGWDRVVSLHVERRSSAALEAAELVVELTGLRGNVILVKEGRILGAARTDDRVRPGRAFEPLPPQEKIDPRAMGPDDLASLAQDEDLTRALVRRIDGVGKATAEDIVQLAGRSSGDHGSLATRLRETIDHLLERVQAPDPRIDPERTRATFYATPAPSIPMESFSQAIDATLAGDAADGAAMSRDLRVDLQRALGRHARTAERLREWLANAGEADRLQHHADLILTHRLDIEAGAHEVHLIDPASGEAVEIRLDPAYGPIENAQRKYRRARRLRRGRPQVERRLKRVERSIEEIRAGLESLAAGDPFPVDAVQHLPSRARDASDGSAPRARHLDVDGHVVFVGRNARDNDRLLREAGPDDVWLHARGVPGSHVIIRRPGRQEIPGTVLEEAARLAARHSKAGGDRTVEVTFAAAKHVRKPKGAPPGLAIVRHEGTLTVQLDPKE